MLNEGVGFPATLKNHGMQLARRQLTTVQVNLGKLCNQTCVHCHVDAGPHKTKENLNSEAIERLIHLLGATPGLTTLDLTGGAPELNVHFRKLVLAGRALGLEVIDRCNLTVLFEPGQETLATFLAENKVRVVASLPCYTLETLETQRGEGVFAKSIMGLQLLNTLGYATSKKSELTLDLVYNPGGAFLPPAQQALQEEYRIRLSEDFNIEFTNLFALANLPVKRFAAWLRQRKQLDSYMDLLRQSFNPQAVENLMCRSLVSISWDGKIYDCDFNQMENLPAGASTKSIFEIENFSAFNEGKIAMANHCFGCTAGAGSSCQGAVV